MLVRFVTIIKRINNNNKNNNNNNNNNGKVFPKFKDDNKNVNFPTQFYLGSISKAFSATEFTEVSFNGSVYDFLADYNFIDKILHIKHPEIFNDKEWFKIMFNVIKQVFIVLSNFSISLAWCTMPGYTYFYWFDLF